MKCFVQFFLLAVLTVLTFCFSERVLLTVPIEGVLEIPDGSSPVNFVITLNGLQHSTITKADGSFTFHEITSGVYLLDVSSVTEVFPQLKLRVVAENGTVSVLEYKYPGAKRVTASYPIVLRAIAPIKYFQVKQPISIYNIIMGNPMMLVMMFTLVVVVAFPKMLSGLSPEELKEFQKQQNEAGDPMQNLQKLMGMGGTKTAEDDD